MKKVLTRSCALDYNVIIRMQVSEDKASKKRTDQMIELSECNIRSIQQVPRFLLSDLAHSAQEMEQIRNESSKKDTLPRSKMSLDTLPKQLSDDAGEKKNTNLISKSLLICTDIVPEAGAKIKLASKKHLEHQLVWLIIFCDSADIL